MQTRGNKRSNSTEERNSENSVNKKKKIVENKIKKKVNKSSSFAPESESKSKEIKKKVHKYAYNSWVFLKKLNWKMSLKLEYYAPYVKVQRVSYIP